MLAHLLTIARHSIYTIGKLVARSNDPQKQAWCAYLASVLIQLDNLAENVQTARQRSLN